MSSPTKPPTLLLVEPRFVLRRAVVAVAARLGVADFKEAISLDHAVAAVRQQRFAGIVLDLGAPTPAIDLLTRLRRGDFVCDVQVPVIGLMAAGDLDAGFASFELHAVLCRPFKIGDLLDSVQRMLTSTGCPEDAVA